MKRKTANNKCLNEYLASKTKINNTGILCRDFSTSFRSANPNFRLRPKLGVRLVFGLSEKTQRKTNPKSEVAHCAWRGELPKFSRSFAKNSEKNKPLRGLKVIEFALMRQVYTTY